MTHSPTPEEFNAAIIARIKADAVAEYKAQGVRDVEVEAAAREVFKYDAPSHEPAEWFGLSEPLKSDYRGTALAALEAARGAR